MKKIDWRGVFVALLACVGGGFVSSALLPFPWGLFLAGLLGWNMGSTFVKIVFKQE